MLGSPNLHKLKSLTRSSFFLWNTASTSAELDILCIGYSCPRVPCQFLGCSLQSGLPSPPLFYLFGKGTVSLESTLIGCAQTAPTVICESAYMFSRCGSCSCWSSHQLEDQSRADSGLQDARHRACPCYQWWLFACLSLWETERNFSSLYTSLRYKVTFLTIVRTCNEFQKALTTVWQREDLSHFLPVWWLPVRRCMK